MVAEVTRPPHQLNPRHQFLGSEEPKALKVSSVRLIGRSHAMCAHHRRYNDRPCLGNRLLKAFAVPYLRVNAIRLLVLEKKTLPLGMKHLNIACQPIGHQVGELFIVIRTVAIWLLECASASVESLPCAVGPARVGEIVDIGHVGSRGCCHFFVQGCSHRRQAAIMLRLVPSLRIRIRPFVYRYARFPSQTLCFVRQNVPSTENFAQV